ncbi:DUF6221 family protein [Streptomyces sp. NBC_01136]|uniref:DUF6221 family protein n=1 Tax=Streptomyces sp. NBC_01136 TaxID=2903754 RepID=UPI00386F1CE6|nr:DUF6221 family protein [Streptomyces sp. NBC_01136]
MTDDLPEWLRTQLDEDERIAKDATPGPWWHNPGKQWLGPDAFEKYDLRQGEEFVGYGGPHPFTGAVASTGPASNMQGMKDAAFIAAHDPARVLREIDAKRKLIETITRRYEASKASSTSTSLGAEWVVRADVLRLLALPYTDRPGYREEWRP